MTKLLNNLKKNCGISKSVTVLLAIRTSSTQNKKQISSTRIWSDQVMQSFIVSTLLEVQMSEDLRSLIVKCHPSVHLKPKWPVYLLSTRMGKILHWVRIKRSIIVLEMCTTIRGILSSTQGPGRVSYAGSRAKSVGYIPYNKNALSQGPPSGTGPGEVAQFALPKGRLWPCLNHAYCNLI